MPRKVFGDCFAFQLVHVDEAALLACLLERLLVGISSGGFTGADPGFWV